MSNQLVMPLVKSYKFNPGFQSDEEAIQNFIVRKQELERIIGVFREGAPSGPRVLVMAPRGAGKTTLCRRLLAEIHRSADLSGAWHPIFLGEESYSVTSPGEFFLECVFHIQERSPDRDMQDQYEQALQVSDEKRLLDRTLTLLRSYSERVGKRLLIIVENFQIILEDQIGSGAKELLKQLRNDKLFGVLATSVSYSNPDEVDPLPSDFLQVPLRPLDLKECHALWKALTDHDVKVDRIRPLQILTGGSPRLLHILAEFMRTPSLRNLMENLNLLIDQNTEYFKSQLDALPATERKVFAALLDAWDPSTAKQVAEAARVNTNVASAMLARLTTRGAVIKESGRGRAVIYYAAERLFNIYYLMRRRSHPSSRVHALVSFMTEYYDRDELINTAAILAREACSVGPDRRTDYHSTFDALLSKAPKAVRARILELAPADFMNSFREHWKAEHGNTIETATSAATPDDGDGDSNRRALLSRARRATERDDHDEAIRLLEEAAETYPDSAEVWMMLSVARLHHDHFDGSISAARRLGQLKGNEAWSLAIEGLAQSGAERIEEARAAFEKALEIDSKHPVALLELAEMYEAEGDEEEAVELYERAHESDALSDTARVRLAQLLLRSDRQEDAEALLREVAGDPEALFSRRALVDMLCDEDREADGISVLKEAAEATDAWQVWADYGSFALGDNKDLATARRAFERAIELGAEEPMVYQQYASALQKDGEDRSVVAKVADKVMARFASNPSGLLAASAIYKMVDAGQKAEASVRSAIELDGGVPALLHLGRLLQKQPSRMSEAEQAFRQAVAHSDGMHVCGPSKELAEILVHRGEDEAAITVLKNALERNKGCYCCTVAQAEIAERNGDKLSARTWYEAALQIQDDGIRALTGLSRIVGRDEAEDLITKAIAAGPRDPRCLLARAQSRDGDLENQIKDAAESVKLRPTFIEAHLFLTPLLAKQGDVDHAFEHLKIALGELPTRRELIPLFVDATMTLAASGAGERVSQLIENDPYGSTLEPLTVALKLKRGEKPVVAKEVMAVAEDIANVSGRRSAVRSEGL